jgi:chemotaxis protein MotB
LRRGKKNNKTENGNGESWMTTYSDMVTLLLAFFVLLYSFSTIDLQRFQEIMSAIRFSFVGSSGFLSGTPEIWEEKIEKPNGSESLAEEDDAAGLGEEELALLEALAKMEETYEKVLAFLIEAELEFEVSLRLEERGIVIELPEKVLFDSGSAEIKADFLPTLALLAKLLEGLNNQIIIEGHTDNVPISTFRYPTNWELSVARAVSVARYFVEDIGLSPGRFVATGYGEFSPIATNETPDGRARNRRVTIVISIKEIE